MKVIGCVIEKMHKNGQMGAHGLNWKIFVKSGFRFAIYDKNYPRKQNFRFLGRFWNLRFSTEPHPIYGYVIPYVEYLSAETLSNISEVENRDHR